MLETRKHIDHTKSYLPLVML